MLVGNTSWYSRCQQQKRHTYIPSPTNTHVIPFHPMQMLVGDTSWYSGCQQQERYFCGANGLLGECVSRTTSVASCSCDDGIGIGIIGWSKRWFRSRARASTRLRARVRTRARVRIGVGTFRSSYSALHYRGGCDQYTSPPLHLIIIASSHRRITSSTSPFRHTS